MNISSTPTRKHAKPGNATAMFIQYVDVLVLVKILVIHIVNLMVVRHSSSPRWNLGTTSRNMLFCISVTCKCKRIFLYCENHVYRNVQLSVLEFQTKFSSYT